MEEKTLHSDIRFTGRVFQVEEMLVRLSDGTSANREIVRHNGGAAVIAIDSENRVVLVRQYRKKFRLANSNPMKIQPHAPCVNCGRKPGTAAARSNRS